MIMDRSFLGSHHCMVLYSLNPIKVVIKFQAPLPARYLCRYTSQPRVPFTTHSCSLLDLSLIQGFHQLYGSTSVAERQMAEQGSAHRTAICCDRTPQKVLMYLVSYGCNQYMHSMPFDHQNERSPSPTFLTKFSKKPCHSYRDCHTAVTLWFTLFASTIVS
jgi:hypothetical protein